MDAPTQAITTDDLRETFPSRKGPVEAVRGVSVDIGKGEISACSVRTGPGRPPRCAC